MAKCDYPPARMDKRVAIQRLAKAPDGQGGYVESWDDDFKVWASFEPLGGYEKFMAMQMQAEVTHKVTLRYRPDVGVGDRIRWGTRLFDIKEALDVDERRRFLRLKCVERSRLAAEASWREFAMPWEEWDASWAASLPYPELATRWTLLNTNWDSMD